MKQLSKHSQRNLAVIENFLLHLTHCSDEADPDFNVEQNYTPEELYRVAYDYILEDHVDGEGADKTEVFEVILAKNEIARELANYSNRGVLTLSYLTKQLQEIENYIGTENQPSVLEIISNNTDKERQFKI